MHTLREQTSNLANFLKDAAESCFRNGVVDHPCRVALLTFDPKANVNRYVSVFGDWQAHCYHYLYPSFKGNDYFADHLLKIWESDISGHGLSEVIKMKLNQELTTLASMKRIGVLDHLKERMKSVRFYAPITGQVYAEMVDGGPRYGDRVFNRPLNANPERDTLEAAHNCIGEWVQGVFYEQCYIGTDTGPFYSVAFVGKRIADGQILTVAASCRKAGGGNSIANALRSIRAKFLRNNRSYESMTRRPSHRSPDSTNMLLKKIKAQLSMDTHDQTQKERERNITASMKNASEARLRAFMAALDKEAEETNREQTENWIGGPKWISLWDKCK